MDDIDYAALREIISTLTVQNKQLKRANLNIKRENKRLRRINKKLKDEISKERKQHYKNGRRGTFKNGG